MSGRNEEWAKKNLDYAISYSVEALKASMLLNGGAALAILTLVGSLSSRDGSKIDFSAEEIKIALAAFGVGVGCAAGAFSSAYFAQIFFFHNALSGSKVTAYLAGLFRVIGVIALLGSGWFFFRGVAHAMAGIHPQIGSTQTPGGGWLQRI